MTLWARLSPYVMVLWPIYNHMYVLDVRLENCGSRCCGFNPRQPPHRYGPFASLLAKGPLFGGYFQPLNIYFGVVCNRTQRSKKSLFKVSRESRFFDINVVQQTVVPLTNCCTVVRRIQRNSTANPLVRNHRNEASDRSRLVECGRGCGLVSSQKRLTCTDSNIDFVSSFIILLDLYRIQ